MNNHTLKLVTAQTVDGDQTNQTATPKLTFSVLMSVYRNDHADHFFEALKSVTLDQDLPPDEVVLVVDGPIGQDLETVVRHWETHPHSKVRLVRSRENVGLARAMNLGLQHCQHPYVARMDSDDLSEPNRFADQIDFLQQNPGIALLGSWYAQYDNTMENQLTDRKVPLDSDSIQDYARRRTPFNHVTAVFDREAVISVGGYPTIDSFMEDWWIALRLLKAGFRLANLPQYHVRVRGDREFVGRRGGWDYLKCEFANLLAMNREQLMSTSDVTTNLILRSGVRLVPNWARTGIYRAIRKVA